METTTITLPIEVSKIAESVSAEKRSEVQAVLNAVFDGVGKMRHQLDAIKVKDNEDTLAMTLASTVRLAVRRQRLEAEKIFDAKREEVQRQMAGFKTEDSLWLKAKQTMQILTKEIEENARWKEETKERFEAEQKELKTQQRMLKVAKVSPEMLRSEFENMSDETFEMFFAGIERAFNDKVEAEKKAEEEKIEKEKAEAEAREKMRIENERLKAEAEAKEKAKKDAEIKAAAELKAKEIAEKKAESAPDIEKIKKYTNEILLIQKPEVKSEDAKELLIEFDVILRSEIESLINQL